MAAAWRPPEGLVLDGREHGGRFRHAGKAIITAIDTSCFTSHARYSVREAEVGSPAKIVLSASSESLLLPTRSVIDERSGQLRPYVRPVSRGVRRWPSWVFAYVSGTNLSGVLEAHGC
jgi:hypothetical protein